jgi:hypothetical protein
MGWFLVTAGVVVALNSRPLFRAILGLQPEPTLEQVLNSLGSAPLRLMDTPEGGWKGHFPNTVRVCNREISVFYTRTERRDKKVAESVHIMLAQVRGGIVATFVDGELTVWERNGVIVPKPNLPKAKDLDVFRILEACRVGTRNESSIPYGKWPY